MTPPRNLAVTIAALVGERGGQTIAAVVITALIARALGPAGFGAFQYLQALAFVASAAALVCGSEVVVPRLARATDATASHQLAAHAFALRLAGAAAGYLMLLLAAAMAPHDPASPPLLPLAAVLGLSILLREPFGISVAWAQAHNRMRTIVAINLVALAVKLLLIVAAWAAGLLTPMVAATIFVAESAAVAMLQTRFYRHAAGTLARPRIDRALLQMLAIQGGIYFIGIAAMMAFRRIDQLLLKGAIADADLGRYAAALQITDNFSLVATIAAGVLAPALVYRLQQARDAQRSVLRLTAVMAGIGGGGALALALLADPLIALIYGARFADAVPLLRAAAAITPLFFIEAGLNVGLLHRGAARLVAAKWLAALGVAALVDTLLIPLLGPVAGIAGLGAGLLVAIALTLFALAVTAGEAVSPRPGGRGTVCLLTGTLNAYAGAERACAVLANALAQRGWQVDVICWHGEESVYPLDERVRLHPLYRTPARLKLRWPVVVLRLRRLLQQLHADVLIDVDTNLAWFSVPAAARLPLTHISWEHAHFGADLGHAPRRIARQLAVRRCDAIVVLTERDRAAWQAAFGAQAPIVALPNPLTIPLPAEPADLSQRTVIAVGRLEPVKGFDLLLQAWQKVQQDFPQWRLNIVGDGSQRGALLAQRDALGLADSVTLAPATAAITEAYLQASVFVLSSRFEGFGLVINEAMACGLAVAAFGCETGPRALIRDGDNGLLAAAGDPAALADALCRLLGDPALRRRVAAQGRLDAHAYAPDAIAARWETLFEPTGARP